VIPNLLQNYAHGISWVVPALVAVVFLRLLTVGHLQARAERNWLDRLRQYDRSHVESNCTRNPDLPDLRARRRSAFVLDEAALRKQREPFKPGISRQAL
jgi:hypothetical protein